MAAGEFVGRQSVQLRALMRTVIVEFDKLNQQRRQLLRVFPGVTLKPLFQRSHETFRDAVRAGTTRRNPDVNQLLLFYKLGKGFCNELGTVVTDDKLKLRRAEDP